MSSVIHITQPFAAPAPSDPLPEIASLVDKEARSFAFGSKRRRTLALMVSQRMASHGISSVEEYLALLRRQPQEQLRFTQDLSNGGLVAGEAARLKALRDVVPRLLAKGTKEVRAWVIGCGNSEEPYLLAMLLLEHARQPRVFATDADAEALDEARHHVFTRSPHVSNEQLEQFFIARPANQYAPGEMLRDTVVFAQHDVLSDPPFGRLDFVSCPGLLACSPRRTRTALLQLLHFALRPGGYVLVDAGESDEVKSGPFEVVSAEQGLFHRVDDAARRSFVVPFTTPPHRDEVEQAKLPLVSIGERVRQQLLAHYAPASAVIDRTGKVLYFHGAVDEFLRYPSGAVGNEIRALARDGLRAALSATVQRAYECWPDIAVSDILWLGSAEAPVRVRIVARPLPLAPPHDDAMLVSFERLADGAGPQVGQRESAESIILHYESALKAAEDELHETINALGAANERLLLSNQEFDAVNAELAASNAALEVSKAELESLNAELSAVNAQLGSNVEILQAAHDDMANLLQSIDIATVFLTEALTVKRFTPAATRLYKLLPSDVGRPISDIAACFDTTRLEEDIAFAVERTRAEEREIRTVNGHWYIQRVTPYRRRDGAIEGVVLSFIDVDELKRIEAELRQLSDSLEQTVQARTRQLSNEVHERRRAEEVLRSERNFVSAVLSTASALVMVLDAHGHIVRFNRACEKASGYTFEEVAGQALLDCPLFLPEDRTTAAHELLELRAGMHPKTSERRWRHRDGSVRLVSWVTSCLVDARGNVDYIIATGIDVSDQRSAEDQARRRLAELTALHRLHTVGELGGIIAHELNQPLAAIAAHSEAAMQRLRRTPRTETAMEDLKQISIQAQRAGSIIRNLRAFLAKGSADSGPVDISAVVGATCQLIVGEARTHHVVIVTDLAADLPLVTAEAVKIEHVLINLIRNGIEAIRDAGMKKGWIKIATVRSSNNMVRVTVADSGPGLNASLRDTLFEPFNSTKAEGLGLGLIISRSLVEQLGGRLWVEPTESSGVFHFTVPFIP